MPRRRLFAVALVLLCALVAWGPASASASARAKGHTGGNRRADRPGDRAPAGSTAIGEAALLASEYRRLTSEVVHGYAGSGERRYADGLWQNGDPSCWYCNAGPADGAAYLAATQPSMLPVAIASFNRAIAEHRLPNGSFSGNTSPAITSAAFGVLLGLAYVRLETQLPAATRGLWQETLAGIADYLIDDRDATWYANGNINCSYAAAFYFAWRATGAQRYLADYEAELQFTVAPPGHLWEGFGLVITRAPSKPDGSDGQGFLTEGSPPGWDPEYSHLQLDFLSTLYAASGDPRVLRLLNLILNQELTRVDTARFTLDARGGARKNEMMSFTSAALPLLVLDGKRPDLAGLLPAAFARLSSEYHATLTYSQHNFYRGVALWLAPVLLATAGVPVVPGHAARRGGTGESAAPGTAGAGAALGSRSPSVSPRVLDVPRDVQVPALEVPGLEYAFAAPSGLAAGAPLPRVGAALKLAAFLCSQACTLSVRPLLVIRRAGRGSPVVLQRDLPGVREALAAGRPLVSRIAVPGEAIAAAKAGRSTAIRLRVTVFMKGRPPAGRSCFFAVRWH